MKWYLYILIVSAVIIAIVIFPSDKARIQKVIMTSEEAVMNEDVQAVMEHVSFNYGDAYGGSYLTLKKRIERLFNTYDDLEVISDIVEIIVNEDKAVADLKVSLIVSSGTERGYLIGDAGSHSKIKIDLEKEKFGWMIKRMKFFRKPEK